MYVPNVIGSFRRPDLEHDGIEAVWVELRTRVGTILTGVVYCPLDGLASLTKEICGMFEEVAQEGKEVVIMGDFNMNMLSPAASRSPLQTTALECNFRQLITEPTRVTCSSKTLIDILFVSHPETFERAGCVDVLNSDHSMIYGVHCKGVEKRLAKVRSIRSFKKCDDEELVLDLRNSPWSVMDIFDSIDDKWEYWKSIFWAVVNKHAPMRKVRVRECSSPWITEEVLRIARARNYYRTKHRKTGSIDDWETFKRLRNASKSAIRKAKAEYFEGICHDVARNPSRTWKQLNKVLGRSHTQRVSMLKSTMGGNVFDDGAIA